MTVSCCLDMIHFYVYNPNDLIVIVHTTAATSLSQAAGCLHGRSQDPL